MIAGMAAILVALFNFVRNGAFDSTVYFPLFCALFCSLLYFNVRGQRRFRQKMEDQNPPKP